MSRFWHTKVHVLSRTTECIRCNRSEADSDNSSFSSTPRTIISVHHDQTVMGRTAGDTSDAGWVLIVSARWLDGLQLPRSRARDRKKAIALPYQEPPGTGATPGNCRRSQKGKKGVICQSNFVQFVNLNSSASILASTQAYFAIALSIQVMAKIIW